LKELLSDLILNHICQCCNDAGYSARLNGYGSVVIKRYVDSNSFMFVFASKSNDIVSIHDGTKIAVRINMRNLDVLTDYDVA